MLDDLAEYFQLIPDPGRNRVGRCPTATATVTAVAATQPQPLAQLPCCPARLWSAFRRLVASIFRPILACGRPDAGLDLTSGRRSRRLRPRKEVDRGLTNGGSGLLNSRQQPVEPEIPQRYAGRSTDVETATIAIIRNSRTPEPHFDVLAAGAANYPVCVDWRKHTADRTPSSTVTSAPPVAPR